MRVVSEAAASPARWSPARVLPSESPTAGVRGPQGGRTTPAACRPGRGRNRRSGPPGGPLVRPRDRSGRRGDRSRRRPGRPCGRARASHGRGGGVARGTGRAPGSEGLSARRPRVDGASRPMCTGGDASRAQQRLRSRASPLRPPSYRIEACRKERDECAPPRSAVRSVVARRMTATIRLAGNQRPTGHEGGRGEPLCRPVLAAPKVPEPHRGCQRRHSLLCPIIHVM